MIERGTQFLLFQQLYITALFPLHNCCIILWIVYCYWLCSYLLHAQYTALRILTMATKFTHSKGDSFWACSYSLFYIHINQHRNLYQMLHATALQGYLKATIWRMQRHTKMHEVQLALTHWVLHHLKETHRVRYKKLGAP